MTDPKIVDRLSIPDTETIVEVPAKLLSHLAKDGLDDAVTNLVPPIVHVTAEGHYIVQGEQISDPSALGQMDIPDHETCVDVPKAAMIGLLAGAR